MGDIVMQDAPAQLESSLKKIRGEDGEGLPEPKRVRFALGEIASNADSALKKGMETQAILRNQKTLVKAAEKIMDDIDLKYSELEEKRTECENFKAEVQENQAQLAALQTQLEEEKAKVQSNPEDVKRIGELEQQVAGVQEKLALAKGKLDSSDKERQTILEDSFEHLKFQYALTQAALDKSEVARSKLKTLYDNIKKVFSDVTETVNSATSSSIQSFSNIIDTLDMTKERKELEKKYREAQDDMLSEEMRLQQKLNLNDNSQDQDQMDNDEDDEEEEKVSSNGKERMEEDNRSVYTACSYQGKDYVANVYCEDPTQLTNLVEKEKNLVSFTKMFQGNTKAKTGQSTKMLNDYLAERNMNPFNNAQEAIAFRQAYRKSHPNGAPYYDSRKVIDDFFYDYLGVTPDRAQNDVLLSRAHETMRNRFRKRINDAQKKGSTPLNEARKKGLDPMAFTAGSQTF